jgi:hypothetical protein
MREGEWTREKGKRDVNFFHKTRCDMDSKIPNTIEHKYLVPHTEAVEIEADVYWVLAQERATESNKIF